jgi:3-oxoacyl-[acyl-carrier protein] reductase
VGADRITLWGLDAPAPLGLLGRMKEQAMDLGLSGKTAIVTGAARGIGHAIARRLATEGAKVVVTDIHAEGTESAVASMRADGFEAHGIVGNVARADDCDRIVAETIERFGAVHIVCNNAGVTRDGFLVNMSEDDWDIVLAVALKGSFLLSKAVMPHLIDQQWGRIVNISSRAYLGNPGQANYSAAKAGLIGLTRALAIEEGRYGVTVNAVAPGFIATEMTMGHGSYEKIKDRAVKSTPVARVGEPEDIADAVAFLASERASFISGETLHVTGGRYG